MTLRDLYLLSPEVSMAGLAIVVILASLATSHRRIITGLTLAGLALPLAFSIALWVDLSNDGAAQMMGLFDTLAVDRFSLFFKVIFIGVVAVVVLASNEYTYKFERFRSEYLALILFSTTGMMLLASTVELISIYVSLELTALPMVALVAIAKDKRSVEAGIKLLVLGAVSSAVLLYGMVFIYGYTGTTYLTVIAQRIGSADTFLDFPFGSYAVLIGVVLIVAGFGFKIASVPFQMWAPDVYEGAPTPITAFLSVASKAAGFAILLRIFYVAFSSDMLASEWSILFGVLSALSMTIGNLIAIAQSNIKRLLAFSTIAHAGYIMVGLAAITQAPGDPTIGPTGVLFYLGAYAATNLAAFFAVIAISEKIESDRIADYAGMSRRAPFLALVLALSMISLIGMPPTAGFMAKVYIFGAAVKSDMAWLAAIGVVNSVVSAYYYLRVVKVMYLSPAPSEEGVPSTAPVKIAIVVTSVSVAFLGIIPGPLLRFAERAADILLPRLSS